MGAVPGAVNDGYGIGFSGSTSLENRYVVNGVDTTELELLALWEPRSRTSSSTACTSILGAVGPVEDRGDRRAVSSRSRPGTGPTSLPWQPVRLFLVGRARRNRSEDVRRSRRRRSTSARTRRTTRPSAARSAARSSRTICGSTPASRRIDHAHRLHACDPQPERLPEGFAEPAALRMRSAVRRRQPGHRSEDRVADHRYRRLAGPRGTREPLRDDRQARSLAGDTRSIRAG